MHIKLCVVSAFWIVKKCSIFFLFAAANTTGMIIIGLCLCVQFVKCLCCALLFSIRFCTYFGGIVMFLFMPSFKWWALWMHNYMLCCVWWQSWAVCTCSLNEHFHIYFIVFGKREVAIIWTWWLFDDYSRMGKQWILWNVYVYEPRASTRTHTRIRRKFCMGWVQWPSVDVNRLDTIDGPGYLASSACHCLSTHTHGFYFVMRVGYQITGQWLTNCHNNSSSNKITY